MEPKQQSASATRQKTLAKVFVPIVSFIKQHQLIPENATIVFGLSGGPDSVFLLYFLLHLRQIGHIKEVVAAHLNHEWRTDSAKDAVFCKQLADHHSIPFVTKKMSDLPVTFKAEGSKEEMARNARRFFLESVKDQYHADAIALGHHLQDQEETFLIRLVRGTSLTGLCAMWPKHGPYIRPLLETNKKDILNYLQKHKIDYLEDPSNKYETMLRNRIRTMVIPALNKADDRFDHSFLKTLNRLQETELYLDAHTQQLFVSISSHTKDVVEVFIDKLLAQPAIMQSRLIMQWLIQEAVSFPISQAFIDEIVRFLRSPEGGTHTIHETWRIRKKRNVAWIERNTVR